MNTDIEVLRFLRQAGAALRARLARAGRDDAGYTTEVVLVTALLVAMALAAIGYIAVKVLDKASGLSLG